MSEYTVTPTEDSIKRMSSSGRFNLYDSWNEMKSGAWVLFVNQVPTSVDLRGSSVEDLEWELEDLGFDGAEVDTLVGYVHFDTEMNKQLKRVGLHKESCSGEHLSIDFIDNSPNVIIYDNVSKSVLSPVRLIRILKGIELKTTCEHVWRIIDRWKYMPAIQEFEGYIKDGCVDEGECLLSLDQVSLIIEKYQKLSAHQKKCFNKWCENDTLAMFELAKML